VSDVSNEQLRRRDLHRYHALAAAARQEAEATALQNVRERCLRSEAAWLRMAAQIERTEEVRLNRLAAGNRRPAAGDPR
jgi:hypothetical protein